jgi:hypothetical protein
MVRPERFERPTYWFVASCSIQLSYGRTLCCGNQVRIPKIQAKSNRAVSLRELSPLVPAA